MNFTLQSIIKPHELFDVVLQYPTLPYFVVNPLNMKKGSVSQ